MALDAETLLTHTNVRGVILSHLDKGTIVRLSCCSRLLLAEHKGENKAGSRVKLKPGELDSVEHVQTPKLIEHARLALDWKLALTVARGGFVDTLKWLVRGAPAGERPHMHSLCLAKAAEGGHLRAVEFLIEQGCPLDRRACSAGAGSGDPEVIASLRKAGCPWDAETCAKAAEGGHLALLRRLVTEWKCPMDERAMEGAAFAGRMDIIEFLRSSGCDWDERAIAMASHGGHAEIVELLRSGGCPWDERACKFAISSSGNLAILQSLIDRGCPCHPDSCLAVAAWRGHIAVARYLIDRWGQELLRPVVACLAARGGHIVLLTELIRLGCPLNEDVFRGAARQGHVAVLSKLEACNCPWSRRACEAAARGGHLRALSYLFEAGCPCGVEAHWQAVRMGHDHVLDYLRQVGVC